MAWLDFTNWQVNFNFSFDKTQTYSIALDATQKPATVSPGAAAAIGVGVLTTIVSFVALFGIVAAAPVEISAAGVIAVIALGLAMVGLAAGVMDAAGTLPGETPPAFIQDPGVLAPPDGGSQFGNGDGSQPVVITPDSSG